MSGKTLVIVESPSKCKKIESFLGNNYKVIASCGHFTKLDSLDQINFENYNINYKVDKGKVLKQLKDEIKKASEVIIATDDDREGEAIGWAICMFCKLNMKTTKKIVFQEITKAAIMKALQNIQHINMSRVKSQQTRQILDIYLGYKVSPVLWKFIQNKLSAGRCQTPALKLIYDNETLFKEAKHETNFTISGIFTDKNILFKGNKNIEKEKIEDFLFEQQEQTLYKINDVISKEKKENPPQILITSTLQQKAYNIFKMSPKVTMKCAQELYENGLITYMRTDSSCYSQEFIDKLMKFIENTYGKDYNHKNPISLKQSKNKNKSQDAHEGIRVCYLDKPEANLKNEQSNKLYRFIYKHTLQCGMSPYVYMEKKYIINGVNNYKFIHNDNETIFDGWKKLENESKKMDKSYRVYLDLLYNAETSINYKNLIGEEGLIGSLSHYNEASLIQKLENMNIGRPSTFSNIVHSVIDKKYVKKTNIEGNKMNLDKYIVTPEEVSVETIEKVVNNEKNKLQITPLGEEVCKFCYENFDDVFNYDFTNIMETSLDNIEQGENSKPILDDFKNKIDKLITNVKNYMKENKDKVKKLKEINSIHCGEYEGEAIFIKHGPYGYYVTFNKDKRVSLKDFSGFSIEKKIKKQENELNEEEKSKLIEYIKISQEKKKETSYIKLNEEYSVRKSQYGYYIFHKNKSMKKPKFLPYNNEKDEHTEERNSWVESNNIEKITNYVNEKYKTNI